MRFCIRMFATRDTHKNGKFPNKQNTFISINIIVILNISLKHFYIFNRFILFEIK